MAGASREQNYVKKNLIVEIDRQLLKTPGQTISGDQQIVLLATGLYTYPDNKFSRRLPKYTT